MDQNQTKSHRFFTVFGTYFFDFEYSGQTWLRLVPCLLVSVLNIGNDIGYRYCRVLGALSYQAKMNALHRFRNDSCVQILILDSTGSLGHDLSFVSHIFIMEPVWDQSLASQV